jgi:hypothetical protein
MGKLRSEIEESNASFQGLVVPGKPIPFFGNIQTAEVFTVGVNPSALEFDQFRNWDVIQSDSEWVDRLLGYFSWSVPPHPWFEVRSIFLKLLGVSYEDGSAAQDGTNRKLSALFIPSLKSSFPVFPLQNSPLIIHKPFMNLYEKHGWVVTLDSYLETLDYARLDPPRVDSIPDRKGDRVNAACNVAICYHLLGNRTETAKYARETVDAVLDYFFGSWQSEIPTDSGTIDPEWWRIHGINWMDEFRYGLCWASALRDWSALRAIAAFPIKETGPLREEKAFYTLLACWLLGKKPGNEPGLVKNVLNGKKEKPRLMLDVFTAIQKKDSGQFERALEPYLHYFRKTEFKRKELDKLLSFDGTTLLNLGRREGLESAKAREFEDYLFLL